LRVHRYLTHAVVLALAVAISSYASINHQSASLLTARLGAVNAEAVTASDGGNVGDVSLGRYSTIIKPLGIPTSAPLSHEPLVYTVAAGQTLAVLAARFHVTVSDIRWSNPDLISNPSLPVGDPIEIPPVPGVVVTTNASDTPQMLGAKYKVDPQVIIDFNRLSSAQLTAGMVLVIPGGVGGAFPQPPPLPAPTYTNVFFANFHLTIGAPVGKYPATGFPWGWCTWYVATRRPVPWRGNAIDWYHNAAAMGFPVGSQPRVGAILVDRESLIGLGHVAYVETVYADGSFLISEMDYGMFGVTDQRLIKAGQLNGVLVGFIYG
jgi:LysM repeat protein